MQSVGADNGKLIGLAVQNSACNAVDLLRRRRTPNIVEGPNKQRGADLLIEFTVMSEITLPPTRSDAGRKTSTLGRSKSAVYASHSTMALPTIRGQTAVGMRGGLSPTRRSRIRRSKSATAGFGSLGNT